MSDERDDNRLLSLWADALPSRAPVLAARTKLLAALDAEPHLPFCAELARAFALSADSMRALLARIANEGAWTRGIAPIDAFFDFAPGPSLAPLRGGFVRLGGGAWLPRHRHRDRELTFVLAGEMVDGDGQRFGPGSTIDMAPGSVHAIGVQPGKTALVALLHGGIEMVQP